MAWTVPTNFISINSVITFGAAWNDIDLTGLVPAGTKAVVLLVRNTSGVTEYTCNVRPNGSSENRTPKLYWTTRRQMLAVVDGNLIFEGYFENSSLDVVVVAYSSDPSFFTVSIDKSTGTTGSYVDTDVSGNVPAGMKSVWLELYESYNYVYKAALRKKGISHDVYERVTHNTGGSVLGWTGIDSNRIFEQKIENAQLDCFLWGYSGNNAQALDTPITKTSTSNGSWNDIDLSGEASIPSSALGVIVQTLVDSGYTRNVNFRKKGSTDNIKTNLLTINNSWSVVGLDANRTFQVYTDFYNYVTFYIVGYIDVGDTEEAAPSHKTKLDKKPFKDKRLYFNTSGISVKKSSKVHSGSVSYTASIFNKTITGFASAFNSVADLVTQKILGLIQKTLEAGISFAGLTINKSGKILSGALTSAGIIVNKPFHSLSGVLTSAGVIVNKSAMSLAGALTSIGTQTGKSLKIIVGALSSTGTQIRKVGYSVAGALSSTGNIFKKILTSFAGACSYVANLATQFAGTTLKSLEAVMSFAADLSTQAAGVITKNLNAAMEFTGDKTRKIYRTIIGIFE